jgi:phosphoglycolate phosphatase-like HAD superfamily hydrolase
MPIKNCIFDFDGTLVDSQKDVFESLTHAFASCGITVKTLDPEIIMQRQVARCRYRRRRPGLHGNSLRRSLPRLSSAMIRATIQTPVSCPEYRKLLQGTQGAKGSVLHRIKQAKKADAPDSGQHETPCVFCRYFQSRHGSRSSRLKRQKAN